jgi:hypothetical protein
MNSNNIIIIILTIIAVLAIYSVAVGEGYCNCTGMDSKTDRPTYYVYKPTGDVSNNGCDLNQAFMTSGSPVIYPEQNLGWRTGMPYDYFENNMTSNNWTAGSNNAVLHVSQNNMTKASPGHKGGYMRNYGSPCGDPSTIPEGLKFITGPSGYPNMLSDGTPQYEGSACSFSSPSRSSDAYDLAVGVL